jgi:ABC-type transport system involved in cytochrome c biogenesis permease component
MLGLLSIFFNALCRVMFSFIFAANTIVVATLLTILMKFYVRRKLYPFSNLILCNPFAFFLMTWDNLLCAIVTRQFILLIVCFYPFVFPVEFSSSNSSSTSQFEFLMQWCFMSFNYDIVVRFILVFAFLKKIDGYFPCYRKARSYHLGF